jgi:hypothetical protein
MKTRSARMLVAVAIVVATAGCLGVLSSDDGLVFKSGETLVENETLAEAGYELQHAEFQTFNETLSVGEGGNDTEIVVRNHAAMYGPKSDLPAGVGTVQVGIITTPDATVAGQSANPLLRMDEYERAFRYLPKTDSQGFERYGNYTVEPFGEPVTVTVLATETDSNEETPTAFVHVMQTQRPDGDVVLAYATHSAETADEAPSIARLFGSLKQGQGQQASETTDSPNE